MQNSSGSQFTHSRQNFTRFIPMSIEIACFIQVRVNLVCTILLSLRGGVYAYVYVFMSSIIIITTLRVASARVGVCCIWY